MVLDNTGAAKLNERKKMRYIKTTIPGTDIEIEFDTVDNTFEYHRPGEQWELIDPKKYQHADD